MSKYKDTKLTIFQNYEEIIQDAIENECEDVTYQLIGILPNQTVVKANLYNSKSGAKRAEHYFLVDETEMKAAMEDQKDDADGIRNLSFEDFSKNYKSIFYIRAFPTMDFKPAKYFAEEVLQVIPAALRNQGSKVDKKLLQNYRKKWKTVNGIYKTIDYAQINAVLEKFDVDKTKIALFGGNVSRFRTPNNSLVLSPLTAAFSLFQHYLCQNYENCKKKDSCIVKFQKGLVATLESLMAMDQTIFMEPQGAYSRIENNLDLMCSECINNPALNMPSQYYRKVNTDIIAISEYHQKCQKWGLPVYPNFMCFGNKGIQIWMVRLFLYGGWIEKSLGSKKKEEIVRYLSVFLNLMVPLEVLDNVYYLDFLNHLAQGSGQPWPAPGSNLEKQLKGYEPIGINFEVFSNWLEAAEKAWQLPENSSEPIMNGFPEID
ncbi:hypothetical protein CAEBREN_24411 [Caenorhabditis brenneri]|uniref:Uncharacterized protein n=1 Tax=Caenorhabditis brenneri TaxID=135651 RepID=G0MWW3_CAEBE|nr:hypothetical protein CAEBREN_24411 [Caenorhabditis brenneri]